MAEHWNNILGLSDRDEEEIAGTGGEKPRNIGHLTYRQGKPVPGLCYCPLDKAHDAEQTQD